MTWLCNRCMQSWDGDSVCPTCGQPPTHGPRVPDAVGPEIRMITLLLAPAHLAGSIVTATVRPPEGSGPAYHVLDREHPDRPGEHIAVPVKDSTTVALSPRRVHALRRKLGPCPEPEDVQRALDTISRGRGSPSITIRVSPEEHRRFAAVAGGVDRIAGWMRDLADSACRS